MTRDSQERAKQQWPRFKGELACARWKGGWLRVTKPTATGKQEACVPLTCGRWDCSSCGNKKHTMTLARVIAAWRLEGQWHPWMITFTYRTKRKFETWEEAGERLGQESITWRRHTWDAQKHREQIKADWSRLRKRWERQYGTAMAYFRTLELTVQGVPHIHAIVQPVGVSVWAVQAWLRKTWRDITGDSDQVLVTQRGRRHRGGYNYSSQGAAIAYVCKYLTKADTKAHIFAGLKYRRYATAGIKLVDIGDRTALEYVERATGEIKAFDRQEYRRVTARMRRYAEHGYKPHGRVKQARITETRQQMTAFRKAKATIRMDCQTHHPVYAATVQKYDLRWRVPNDFWDPVCVFNGEVKEIP